KLQDLRNGLPGHGFRLCADECARGLQGPDAGAHRDGVLDQLSVQTVDEHYRAQPADADTGRQVWHAKLRFQMNLSNLNSTSPNPNRARGMTLVEMVVTLAVSSILLTVVMTLFLFALRSFGAMTNYTEMDGKSQHAVDLMLREIRESNLVVGYQTN